MEVNKDEAERCRDMGATLLRRGDTARAIKLLKKSLQLYPLPGVEALLAQAEGTSSSTTNGSSSSSTNGSAAPAPTTRTPAARSESTGADGRSYTEEQVEVVRTVLRAKEGGRGAHYRVLGIEPSANEAQIKKAYRRLSLKVHPDKNAAPHADEAFKAVGLAYATLSDEQKRHIYDRYGEEDPDNRGGGAPGGMHMRRGGQQVDPEDIFNMFFGGGMPGMHGGGGGFHVYTSGFGPGMQFRAARPRQRAQPGAARREAEAPGLAALLQFLPILLIAALSFLKFNDGGEYVRNSMPGEGKYFTLTLQKPFQNRIQTSLTEVKDIPYYVTDRFLHTYYKNRYQLAQVELMVEKAYEQYLVSECKTQLQYKRQLESAAAKERDEREQARKLERAAGFELTRCSELEDLFPRRKRGSRTA